MAGDWLQVWAPLGLEVVVSGRFWGLKEVVDVPLHQAGGEKVRVRCRCAYAAVGSLHDRGEDEAAVDASGVGDVDDRFVDRRDFVFGVAGDFPSVAGFVDGLLVGREPGKVSVKTFQAYH